MKLPRKSTHHRQDSAIAGRAGVFAAVLLGLSLSAAQAATVNRQISQVGTGFVQSRAEGSDAVQSPELDPGLAGLGEPDVRGGDGDRAAAAATSGRRVTNRSIAKRRGHGDDEDESSWGKAHPELKLSIDGLNFRQQRVANGGNQFSVEPPDQALCVGNGFVVEVVNTVLRVFDTSGNALSGVVDLNTFYGYAPAINRATGQVAQTGDKIGAGGAVGQRAVPAPSKRCGGGERAGPRRAQEKRLPLPSWPARAIAWLPPRRPRASAWRARFPPSTPEGLRGSCRWER